MDIKDIESSFKWKEYENPNFKWSDYSLYKEMKFLNIDFFDHFKDKIDWNTFLSFYNKKITDSFIERYIKNINFYKVLRYSNWYYICTKCKLSEEFMIRNSEYINFLVISKYQTLSESFIEKFKSKVDWKNIAQYQSLSEKFIEKYLNKLNLSLVCGYQKLSESFIEKYKDKVDWGKISNYQFLSKDFIEKFKSRIKFGNLYKNGNIDDNTKYYFRENGYGFKRN